MKKLYSLVAVSMLAIGTYAQTVEVTDTFDYTGALNANGWSTHSGTTPGQLQAAGGVANLISGNTEDVNKALANSYALSSTLINKVTYSATVNVLNATGLNATGDYFMSLGATAGTPVTVLPARLYVKAGTSGYILGVLNTSGGTATPTWSAVEIPYGTATNIVMTYIVDNISSTQYATLLIGAQPLLTNMTGTGAAPATIASVALRQGSGTGNIDVDNIVVTSFVPSSTLAVTDVINVKSAFVQNTQVTDAIHFGSKADVKIYNMNGQVVKTASVSNTRALDASDLQPGMYIVTGSVDGQPVSQKILKK